MIATTKSSNIRVHGAPSNLDDDSLVLGLDRSSGQSLKFVEISGLGGLIDHVFIFALHGQVAESDSVASDLLNTVLSLDRIAGLGFGLGERKDGMLDDPGV